MSFPPANDECLALIKSYEGLHDGDKSTKAILEPEKDPLGKWTIGWGYLLTENGDHLQGDKDRARAYAKWKAMFPKGMTLADADGLLVKVVAEVTDALGRLVKVDVNRNQANALTSLVYNIGAGIQDGVKGDFADSTLLARLNAKQFDKAADQFLQWNKGRVGGVLKPIKGLTLRREREREIFITPVASKSAASTTAAAPSSPQR